jgi:hypothetical protein
MLRTVVNLLIVVLTLGTAVTHLYLGLLADNSRLLKALYLLNGLGYLALLVPLFVQHPLFTRHRVFWHLALIAYTGLTIAAYVYTHSTMMFMSRLEWINKANEAALILVLLVSLAVQPKPATARRAQGA